MSQEKSETFAYFMDICFNWISVLSGDVQELQVYRKENEMENSFSDIGEEHSPDCQLSSYGQQHSRQSSLRCLYISTGEIF